jgi:hypothetical protein
MSDLHNWFLPVKELTSMNSAKTIPSLVALIKDKLASISCSKPGRACSPIMTAIRLLLCYVTTPPASKGKWLVTVLPGGRVTVVELVKGSWWHLFKGYSGGVGLVKGSWWHLFKGYSGGVGLVKGSWWHLFKGW